MASASSSSTTTWEGYEKEFENAFHGIAPSATCSKLPAHICDVFINHRGIDVKHTLASSIYHTLKCMEVRAFLDMEELELGDCLPTAIQEAMQSASLHIAIFSENYAQSAWCLAELSFMLKTGNKIIPIFYHVKPGDLRRIGEGKGIYAEAFAQHAEKGRYDSQKLEDWKTALYKVSFQSGWELNRLHQDQGRLLKNIVNIVLKEMKNVPLEVAKHPVGLNKAVKEFKMTLLQSGESYDNVKIVGIVGMGGCGKTTLAKELYNRESPSFHGSSFLFDVRDSAAKNMLHNLLKKLLEDLLHISCLTFHNISEGKGILASRLRSRRVLIVLDDIDHVDQINALLPPKESLGSGSMIIVTTRDMAVLVSSNISYIYKMRGLDVSYARELFCWHAFLRPCSPRGFESLVKQFLNVCHGLPLSLKVLGGQLYGKPKNYWKSQLHKILRILPQDIKQRLKISYDALDEEEQEIFLDIACFFIGEKISLAITIWDGSGWSGLHSIETLLNKSLVELDQQNRFKMHDHLRDLGRQIAIKMSPSRFWFPKPLKERVPIRGIMAANTVYADFEEYPHCTLHYQPPFIECMELLMANSSSTSSFSLGLQLLVVKGDYFNQQFAELSRDLVWLRWFDFQHVMLPPWLLLRNLHVLELHDAGALQQVWEPDAQPPFPHLRELTITSSWGNHNLQSFPRSIGFLKHLKKIALLCGSLSGEFNIISLPEEFCLLQSLEHLELHCTMLSSLPTHFGALRNLRYIDLYNSKELTALPLSFKQLTQLEYLDLSLCKKLSLEKDILENITTLEKIRFPVCQELQDLPPQITNQVCLRELNLDDTKIKELPADIHKLSKLEVLKIGSPLLTSLPTSLGNLPCLTRFTISRCPKLKHLPASLRHLDHLQYLKLGYSGVESLPKGLRKLSNLQTLEIIECPVRKLPLAYSKVPFLDSDSSRSKPLMLPQLKKITLWNSQVSTILISEECCPSLETLESVKNGYLKEISALPNTVKFVRLSECSKLKNITGISGLVNLQKLMISVCPKLEQLPSFIYLTSLKELEIEISGKVKKIEGIEHLRSLETLILNTCWKEPGRTCLKDLDRLLRLQLVAENRSALETCFGTIRKRPCEMTIAGRVAGDVKSIVGTLAFPNLTIVDTPTLVQDASMFHDFWWMLQFPETLQNASAIIVCFVIDCFQDTKFLVSVRKVLDGLSGSSSSSMRLREGKWLYIGVFTEGSLFVEDLKNSFVEAIAVDHVPEKYLIKMGMMVVMSNGEEEKISDTLYQLLALLDC